MEHCAEHSGVVQQICGVCDDVKEMRIEVRKDIKELSDIVTNMKVKTAVQSAKVGAIVAAGSVVIYKGLEMLFTYLPKIPMK